MIVRSFTLGKPPKRPRALSWSGLLLAGCASNGHADLPSTPVAPVSSVGYGITALVEIEGHPEESGWVRVPPLDWQSWATEAEVKARLARPAVAAPALGQKAQGLTAPPRHTEATVRGLDGGVTDTVATDADFRYAPGWSLLYWATTACFGPLRETEASSFDTDSLWINASPWRTSTGGNSSGGTPLAGYYIFAPVTTRQDKLSCDHQLLMQETLLCAADHLAQLGDSPGTVIWSGIPRAQKPAITVTIPPQRTDDIFIARDMALNALAHLLRLDTRKHSFLANNVVFESTCTARYANLGEVVENGIENVVRFDANTYFDSVPLQASDTVADLRAAGARRLARKAKVLASAARLAKDLIERSVQDDISGAQQRQSSETDAHVGARLAWGADATGTPYNTLRHALRTLFGRLEIGNRADPFVQTLGADQPFEGAGDFLDWVPHEVTRDDPQCSPFASSFPVSTLGSGIAALDEPFGLPSLSARWDDIAPKTTAQAKALALLDSAGVVLPTSVAKAAGAAQVKAAVVQLFAGDETVSQVFQATSEEDIAFALERNYDAFRLLTESEDDVPLADAPTLHGFLKTKAENAGLTVQESASVDALGGIVVKGGLPRQELAVDPLASLSKLQHLSSCGVYARASTAEFPIAASTLEDALGPNGDDVTVFQNPFLLGEGFRRQLGILADEAANASAPEIGKFSQLAAAEVREWAGPGTLLTQKPSDTPESQQNLYLVNISLQDLGVASTDELGERLILVSSAFNDSSVIANCLAGLRKSCPTIADPTANGPATDDSPFRKPVGTPEYVDLGPQQPGLSHLSAGLDHPTIKLVYPYPTTGDFAPGSYAVLLPKNGASGQVMGWLRTPDAGQEFFAESYSRLQRTLASRVFGLGRGTEPTRSCTNVAPVSLPIEYCIAGMQRDQFVPLANELNSTGVSTSVDDSWKNYLDNAQAAAIKADQLGEQLIKDGLDPDLRKESATEDLGNLCGSYLSVDNVTAVNGKVEPPAGDNQLAQCLKPDTKDIVFLRQDPFGELPDEDASNKIRHLYCKGAATDPPFCARTAPDGSPTIVSHAGLGFASSSTTPLSGDIGEACADIHGALSPLANATGGNDPTIQKSNFGNAIKAPWATAQGLAETLQGMQLDERANGEWTLTVGSRILMGSDALINALPLEVRSDVWPYCASQHPDVAGCSTLANLIRDLFPALAAPDDKTHAELRSQLEATIFYMGAMAGQLPAGVIRKPVPVANRSNPALTNAIIPAPALYSQSYFLPNGIEKETDLRTLDSTNLRPLYTITNLGQGGGSPYSGKVPWDGQESSAMKPAHEFSTAAELDYLNSHKPGTPFTVWRDQLYAQAHQGNYLYVDTSNAPLAFDPSLVAGAPATAHWGREFLPAWLGKLAGEFESKDEGLLSGSLNSDGFLAHVYEASFLTAPGQGPDATTPPPYRMCGGKSPNRGRYVCTGAPVSPIFYYSYQPGEQCDGAQVAGLQTSIYATDHVQCVFSDGSDSGVTFTNSNTPAGFACKDSFNAGGDPPVFLSPIAVQRKQDGREWLQPWAAARGSETAANDFGWVNGVIAGEQLKLLCSSPFDPRFVDASCPGYGWSGPWGAETTRGIWQDRLKPSVCPPEERLELFLENTILDRVVAMQTLVRGLGLSCIAGNGHVGIRLKDNLPTIRTTEDINVLQAWLNLLGFDVDKIADVLYLVDVPSDVVTVAKTGSADVGAVTSGERGKLILDVESKLNLLENGFSTLGSVLQQISGAIRKARQDIADAQLTTHTQLLSVAGAKIENDRQRALAYIQVVAGLARLAVGAATSVSIGGLFDDGASAANAIIDAAEHAKSAATNLAAAAAIDRNLVEKATDAQKMGQNAEAQAVLALSQTTASLYQSVNDTITGLKNNNNAALQDIASLKQNASKATLALAKAAGADFMEINGKQIPNHVNTVYRRQFDLTKQRYHLAVESAKRTAYLARLSIEQRLGVRLDQLHQNIGPLEAPATWVDSLCTVQGVDYSKFRTATPGVDATSPGEVDLVKGFANQFIGDYIDKLRQFVQFYNVQFPFVDSNDVAVVSLREDLPGKFSQCVVPSNNLLLYSDALSANSPEVSVSDMIAHGGWRVTQCEGGACLSVKTRGSLSNNVPAGGPSPRPDADFSLSPPGGNGQASLLVTIPEPSNAAALASAATAGASGTANSAAVLSPAPASAVFQTVALRAKVNYVLSWWDMARSADGTQDSGSTTSRPYTVAIFDANWTLVSGDTFIPAASTSGLDWSARRTLQAVAPADGDYHVVFTAGPSGQIGAAVAIANVQLENGSGNGGDAGPYESNGATTLHATGRCNVDTPDQFRSRFTRKCDKGGCFFELNDVLAIDTQVLNQGASSLIGKLAPGNYNYRNNTLALNVVGTGLIDCSQAPAVSCNGSAYVQYDLDHVAYNVPVEDYEGTSRCFDFGAGSVKGGKALASERFITLPMSSSDKDMIDQAPFLKPEFSGRPLSGSYRLRIHDAPQLVWKNVDDIQLVMNYGYWSRVARSPGN